MDEERNDEARDLRAAAVHGIRSGFVAASCVGLPIALLVILAAVGLTAFGFGAGRGFTVPPFAFGAVAFYALTVGIGVIAGLLFSIGGRLGGIGRGRPAESVDEDESPDAAGPTLNGSTADPVAVRWRRWAAIWPWLVFGSVALAVVGGLATGAGAGRFVDRRLADAIAAADRDDPHWRIDDLMAHREAVPDAENGAEVVADVVARLPGPWPADPPPPGLAVAPPSPTLEAFNRLSALPGNVRPDEATAATLREALDGLSDAVLLARSLVGYDRGRHELDLGPSLIDTPLPETQDTRLVARLLQADATIRALDGDPDGALESCRALLVAGRTIGDEPFLISQLVRFAIGGVGASAACRVLGLGEASDAELARLQALLLRERDEPLLLHGLRGERGVMDEILRRLAAGEMAISALSERFDPEAPVPPVASWGRLMFEHQRAIGLEWLNEAVAIARRPSHEQWPLWDAWDAELLRVRRSPPGPFVATIPLLMVPALQAAATAEARYRADLGATALVVAAERQRIASGDWPDGIEAIDPEILPEAPLDPFSGQPYRFRREEDGLIIYSVGPNGQDDGGQFHRAVAPTGGPDDLAARAWDLDRRRQDPPTVDEEPEP